MLRFMKRSLSFAAATAAVSVLMLATSPAANATQLHNQNGALACKEYKLSSTQKVQACTDVVTFGNGSGGVYIAGAADVTAYQKVKINNVVQWIQDNSVLVSEDSVSAFADGSASAAIGYPSGPLAGYASGSTRQTGTVDGSVTHSAYSTATLGVWQNGTEIKTINVQSYTVTIPVQS